MCNGFLEQNRFKDGDLDESLPATVPLIPVFVRRGVKALVQD